MNVVGTSPTKADALAKAVGDTLYGDDFHLPGELHARVVRAAMTPARIKKIDASRALALPGVHCVLTAKDIPGVNAGRYADYPVMAEDVVRDIGDAVAIVAAESRDLAAEAASLVHVAYEPLPGAYDFMKPEGEIICDWNTEKGDVDAAFARPDVVTVENVYFSACLDHAYIEPEGGVAWVDERGVVNVRVPTQTIENYQKVASILGLPASRVRYECPMLGGAFGGKEHPLLGAFLALLAMRTGRPVRMAYSREESVNTGSKRHPFLMRYKTAATRDGKLAAVEVDILADAGGYASNSKGLVMGALCISGGPYEIPNARGRARAVLTNNPFTEAMRGVGANQVCFAYESQMDELAKRLGMDPVEFRRRNFIKKGGTLMQKQPLPSRVMLPELLEKAIAALGGPAGRVPEKDRGPWRRGRSLIGNMGGYGRPRNEGEVYASLEDDGSVNLRVGASDVGAGQTHAYRQIASEVLGIPWEKVTVVMSDSHVTPLVGITAGSRQTLISGGATHRTGLELRSRLLKGAGELLEVSPEDLDIRGGRIFVKSAEERGVTVAQAVKKCRSMGLDMFHTGKMKIGDHRFEGHEKYGDAGGWMDYTFGVHGAEVEVNVETGEVRLLRYVSGHDVGQAINVQHVEGQFEGGTMMGIGHGLSEEIVTRKGAIANNEFHGYLIPTAVETPEWANVIEESQEGLGPYGAKGIGEPPCTAGAAAVACAVSHAIGARITRIPITPDHVLEVLGKLKKSPKASKAGGNGKGR
ncbi:MAG: xanthine dehydrogenase family protein [Candidatus Tectomicrobia bacterium]|uniref:Xanthine dehydrogenase family protein n=1 Tax=Tectimicrobiota bacterium TaxID=2528274 RepID=A0A932HWJ7_UNCTE|nr:xanthine dehydrogenase family protein [Candidatus Tectomicrobia bacterium]